MSGALDSATLGENLRRRIYSLDVLRGVAILLVLCRHAVPDRYNVESGLATVVGYVCEIGWCGVDLFFVLSGFLISRLIFREYLETRKFRLGRFWLRRGLRIWPAYFIGYGSMWAARLLWAVARSDAEQARQLTVDGLWNALFVQNYVRCERWPHSWSLAVEEHFYLILPVLLMTLAWVNQSKGDVNSEKRFRGLGLVAVALVGLVLWMRWQVSFPAMDWHAAYYRTHMRMDSLFAGVVLGHIESHHRDWAAGFRYWVPLSIVAVLVCGIVPGVWRLGVSPWCTSVGFTLLWMGFACIVMTAVRFPQAGTTGSRFVTWPCRVIAALGVYSYTVYIGHSILFGFPGSASLLERVQLFMSDQGSPKIVRLIVDQVYYVGGSIGLGVVLAHGVERPFLRLRSRLAPARTEVVPV